MYICMYEYYPFSPHDGITNDKFTYFTFFSSYDNFDFSSIIIIIVIIIEAVNVHLNHFL
jgi:hypothetical protein